MVPKRLLHMRRLRLSGSQESLRQGMRKAYTTIHMLGRFLHVLVSIAQVVGRSLILRARVVEETRYIAQIIMHKDRIKEIITLKPIEYQSQGSAVDDVQQRLTIAGYEIAADEREIAFFGDTTLAAVRSFRRDVGLDDQSCVDEVCWDHLVDASFVLGDRALYLRYPNYHGNDVRRLQFALNALGFACGKEDGIFGVHTEAALKEFQTNMNLPADGIAFEETFQSITRLHHAWESREVGAHSQAHTSFVRMADVLEHFEIAVSGEQDLIACNVASRMWNIAAATTDASGLSICDSVKTASPTAQFVLELVSVPKLEPGQEDSLLKRARLTLFDGVTQGRRQIRVEIPGHTHGAFTPRDAQKIALHLIDALCEALSQDE